jgi:transposase
VWRGLGYNDTCADKIELLAEQYPKQTEAWPEWMGDWDFHESHQSNLIRKAPSHYLPIFGPVPSNLEYIWPKL